MYYIPKKLAFIPHPRNASRTVWRVVQKAGAIRSPSRHKMDMKQILEVQNAGGVIACVKRNMFDILVSHFHMMMATPRLFNRDEFTEWLIHEIEFGTRYTNRNDAPLYHYGLPHCNFVIDFENLGRGLHKLMFMIRKYPTKIEHVGKSDRLPYQECYTPETRALVEERWAVDLTITGYSF